MMHSGASAPLFFVLLNQSGSEVGKHWLKVADAFVRCQLTQCSPVGLPAAYANDVVFSQDPDGLGKGLDQILNGCHRSDLIHGLQSSPSPMSMSMLRPILTRSKFDLLPVRCSLLPEPAR